MNGNRGGKKEKNKVQNNIKSVHHEDISFIHDVLKHYEKNGRHTLVWRKRITPYRILVSEVMLQQTQVTRVLPKFDMWMRRYPTLDLLKVATLKDVLIVWQGLGYQRRAKALVTIAKKVKKIPKTFDELLLLPGVGRYTASALCAFAYNEFSHPVLETNIRTALIEYFFQGKDEIHDGMLYDVLSRLETNYTIKTIGARKWYYALMDFGAYLKEQHISHNAKSIHHKVQSQYKGSQRELRAKTLFAIIHGKGLPRDVRLHTVLEELEQEGFIVKKKSKYFLLETT
jgi:A/G-specific adenine glycosylase